MINLHANQSHLSQTSKNHKLLLLIYR